MKVKERKIKLSNEFDVFQSSARKFCEIKQIFQLKWKSHRSTANGKEVSTYIVIYWKDSWN